MTCRTGYGGGGRARCGRTLGSEPLRPRRAPSTGQLSIRADPGVLGGCGAIGTGVLADCALDAKANELIALAIAMAMQRDGSMAAHGHGAAGRNAAGVEVAEALGVAIMMNGEPGSVHALRALAAFEQFATKP